MQISLVSTLASFAFSFLFIFFSSSYSSPQPISLYALFSTLTNYKVWENTSQKNCSDSCWVGVAPVISSKTDMKSRTIFMSLSTAEMKKMIAWARTQKRTKPLSISLKCRFWFIHVGYSLTIWFVTSNQPCCPWDTVWVAKMNAL